MTGPTSTLAEIRRNRCRHLLARVVATADGVVLEVVHGVVAERGAGQYGIRANSIGPAGRVPLSAAHGYSSFGVPAGCSCKITTTLDLVEIAALVRSGVSRRQCVRYEYSRTK